MQTKLNPYLSFRDTARQAMEFYESVFGGKLQIDTFGENQMSQDPADADKVMHAQLDTENGFTLMASDTPPGMDHKEGSSISISLSGDNEAELRGYWDKLCDGGTVALPLEKAPWGDFFGMVVDKFGTAWMVNIAGAKQG